MLVLEVETEVGSLSKAKLCLCRPCHRHEASPLVPITILPERHRHRWVGNLENLINHPLRRSVLGLGPNNEAIHAALFSSSPLLPPHSHASFFVADAEAGDAADKQLRLGSAENKVRSNVSSGRLHDCSICCL